MQDELTLLTLILVALLPGWFLLRPTIPDPLARAFASLTLGLTLMGWLALLLAKLGIFNGWLIIGSWLLVASLWLLAASRQPPAASRQPPATSRQPPAASRQSPISNLQSPLLFLWLLAACWLFFRPHEFIHGAADAGVYVNQAANLAQTGQLLIDDPELADLDPQLIPLFLRERPAGEGTRYYLFPAFNVDDNIPGRVIPEFFPLHPVWQAVAYQFGGVQAALKIVGLWTLLGSLAVYLNLRRLVPWPFAFLGLTILSLNAMQVWFARYPVSESLNQYLLWAGLWALGNWLSPTPPFQVSETSKGSRINIWPLLAALTLGQLLFVRIDALFLLAIPLLVALWLYLTGQWATKPGKAWFFVPYALLTAHAVWHITTTSAPYFIRLANYVELILSTLPAGLLFIPIPLALLALYLIKKLDGRRKTKDGTTPHTPHPTLYTALTIAILALALFAWFIRPTLPPPAGYTDWYANTAIPTLNHENLIRLGWYLSPVGIWLGIIGMCLMVWRLNRRLFIILGVGAFYTLLYQWRIQANPHQIYAMRRYLPATLPFFIIAATYLIAHLRFPISDFRLRLAAAQSPITNPQLPFTTALSLIWLATTLLAAQPFLTQIDQRGFISQLNTFNTTLDPHAVLLFNSQRAISQGDTIGTALQYQYGHTVYTIREDPAGYTPILQQAITDWHAAGRTVYWLGDPTWLDQQTLPYTTTTTTLTFPYLETPYDHKPQDLLTANWVLTLSEIDR